jgi:hypothetical protein
MIVPREVEQVDIAPSIASLLGPSFPCDGEVIDEIVDYANGSNRTVLAIVDSLGFEDYLQNRGSFPFTSFMESQGLLFKCLSYDKRTTPSIASILCGLKPEKHGIKKTEDAYVRKIKCLPEVAYEWGLKVVVVMEEYGALSFQGLVSSVKAIRDRPDVLEFDEEACYQAVSAMNELDPNLLVVHFRSLDVLGFVPESVKQVDCSLRTIAENLIDETIFFVVGDHPPHHREDEKHVALIVSKLRPELNGRRRQRLELTQGLHRCDGFFAGL